MIIALITTMPRKQHFIVDTYCSFTVAVEYFKTISFDCLVS